MELDIEWQERKLTGATLRSKLGGPFKVRYGQNEVDIQTRPGADYRLNGQLALTR
jgi:hypothetical protein